MRKHSPFIYLAFNDIYRMFFSFYLVLNLNQIAYLWSFKEEKSAHLLRYWYALIIFNMTPLSINN